MRPMQPLRGLLQVEWGYVVPCGHPACPKVGARVCWGAPAKLMLRDGSPDLALSMPGPSHLCIALCSVKDLQNSPGGDGNVLVCGKAMIYAAASPSMLTLVAGMHHYHGNAWAD